MAEGSDGFEIGVASVDITPPVGVELAGYGSRKGKASVAVGHPLRAEAMVVKGADGAMWALLTSDIIGYNREIVTAVRQRVADQMGLRPDAILISGTHTHSAPSLRKKYDNELDEYPRELEQRLADVIVRAAGSLSPGTFEVAWTQAPDLAHNRRVVHDDGTAENEWLDADGDHTGYFDPDVLLVAVRRSDGTRDALIVNYGCHPVVLGPSSLEISADYPGYLKDMLEKEDVARTVMFALAGGGNINPRVCIQVGAEFPKKMGETLAQVVLDAVDDLKEVAAGPVASSSQTLTFRSERDWGEDSGRQKGEPLETEIMALRAGDLAVVSLPGELFSEYAAMLREASPVPETVVVSLANDSVGYLPLDEALPQGGHEVLHRGASEGVEQPIMEAARRVFKEIEG